jgi:ribosome-binding protein aMBF1 (putative translation factor)
VYAAPLVVPYGLATTVSDADVAAALAALSEGRAEVRAEVAGVPGVSAADDEADAAPSAERDGDLPRPRTPMSPDVVPVGASTRPVLTPSGPPAVTAKPVVALPLRPAVPTADHPAARREDVRIAMRREPVDGTLALSAQPDDVLTEELPEIAELRRHPGERGEAEGPRGSGNIALIIDATTDLSARAMSKVREASAQQAGPTGTDAADLDGPAVVDGEPGAHVGARLRQARENLRLSVDDLADRTRIRPYVIECMEADDFSPCGGDFYARGHLRMLARVLGIASDPLIELYDEHFATSPVSLRAVFDAELASGGTGMVRGGAAGANWGGLVAAVVILLIIWGVARYFAGG